MGNFDELFKIKANIVIREVQQCSSPSFTWVVCSQLTFKQPITATSLEVEYQLNILRILATALSIFSLFCAISATIWLGVNSPGFNWRYSSQLLHLLGGSEDPGWTLTFLIKPLGQVVASPLFNNHAEGKVTTREHSVGGAKLDTCVFKMMLLWWHRHGPEQYNGWPCDHSSPGPTPIPH